MTRPHRVHVLDLIVTSCLLVAGIAGLFQARSFPGRASMWPTFVLVALIAGVGLHLFNLVRGAHRLSEVDGNIDTQEEGAHADTD